MPNYWFHCPNGHEFEVNVPIDERNEPQYCDLCGEKGERQISVPGTVLKGDHWFNKGGY